MITITPWQKYYARRHGKKDAKRFGKVMLYANTKGSNTDYPISPYMEKVTHDYKRACDKLKNRNGIITKAFRKMVQEYDAIKSLLNVFDEETKQLNNMFPVMEKKKDRTAEELEMIQEHYNEVNENDVPIDPGSGATTFQELYNLMQNKKAQYEKSVLEYENLDTRLKRREAERQRIIEHSENRAVFNAHKDKFTKYYNRFKRKINLISANYERRFSYYWENLISRLPTLVLKHPKITFEGICKRIGVEYPYNDMFNEEIATINGEMKDLLGFDIKL